MLCSSVQVATNITKPNVDVGALKSVTKYITVNSLTVLNYLIYQAIMNILL